MSEDAGGIESASNDKILGMDKRMATLGVLALVIVGLIAAAATGMFQVDSLNPQNGDQSPADTTDDSDSDNMSYAGANESTTHDVSEQESQTADVAVTIMSQGVSPSRYETQLGAPVKFYNDNSFPVRMEFDRSDATPTIEGDSSYTTSFNGITYYSVYNDNTDELVGKGSVYVE